MPAPKKVKVESEAEIEVNWQEYVQIGALLHCKAFKKRYNSLKKEGLKEEDINAILLGELSFNISQQIK